jgi:hypothetical protein
MFALLSATDMRLIGRGLLVLLIIILMGTVAVQKQLYHLTQSPEYARAIAMRQEADGSYRLLLLGRDYIVHSLYRIGSIATGEKGVSVEIAGVQGRFPRIYYVDGRRLFVTLASEFHEFEIWAGQVEQELRESGQYWRQRWDRCRE